MLTVDVHKFLVCFLSFFAVSDMLFFLNKTAIRATADLLSAAFHGEVAKEEEPLCTKCAEEEEALCSKCAEKDVGKTD